MVIIFKKTLQEFAKKHSGSRSALNRWHKLSKASNWVRFSDIKETFPDADYVGNDRYVFNMRGNSYRLVAMIFFSNRTVYIRFLGTQADYDTTDCSTI